MGSLFEVANRSLKFPKPLKFQCDVELSGPMYATVAGEDVISKISIIMNAESNRDIGGSMLYHPF